MPPRTGLQPALAGGGWSPPRGDCGTARARRPSQAPPPTGAERRAPVARRARPRQRAMRDAPRPAEVGRGGRGAGSRGRRPKVAPPSAPWRMSARARADTRPSPPGQVSHAPPSEGGGARGARFHVDRPLLRKGGPSPVLSVSPRTPEGGPGAASRPWGGGGGTPRPLGSVGGEQAPLGGTPASRAPEFGFLAQLVRASSLHLECQRFKSVRTHVPCSPAWPPPRGPGGATRDVWYGLGGPPHGGGRRGRAHPP